MQEEFPGTIFRFPLRTQLNAKTSEINQSDYSTERVKEIISKFMEKGDECLLFLNHLKEVICLSLVFRCELKIFEWENGASGPELIWSASANTGELQSNAQFHPHMETTLRKLRT